MLVAVGMTACGVSHCDLPNEKVEKVVPVLVLVLVFVRVEADDDKVEEGCCAKKGEAGADGSHTTPYWSRWSIFPAAVEEGEQPREEVKEGEETKEEREGVVWAEVDAVSVSATLTASASVSVPVSASIPSSASVCCSATASA